MPSSDYKLIPATFSATPSLVAAQAVTVTAVAEAGDSGVPGRLNQDIGRAELTAHSASVVQFDECSNQVAEDSPYDGERNPIRVALQVLVHRFSVDELSDEKLRAVRRVFEDPDER